MYTSDNMSIFDTVIIICRVIWKHNTTNQNIHLVVNEKYTSAKTTTQCQTIFTIKYIQHK